MLSLPWLDALHFPAPQQALREPNGLLAVGGDLSVARLQLAYSQGIFPWFSEGEPILWWSPDPRGVVRVGEFQCSRSLAKVIRQGRFSVSINTAFEQVIIACANIKRADQGTWITSNMQQAYLALHKVGSAHSIEVWQNGTLVGGLYGVASGPVFCGESMFHTASNASKVAFYYLHQLMQQYGGTLIDCQMPSSHLASMGCKSMARKDFLTELARAQSPLPETCWQARWLTP